MKDTGLRLLNPEVAYYLKLGGGIVIALWLLGTFWRFLWLDASRYLLRLRKSLLFDNIKSGLQKSKKKRLNASTDG